MSQCPSTFWFVVLFDGIVVVVVVIVVDGAPAAAAAVVVDDDNNEDVVVCRIITGDKYIDFRVNCDITT